MALSQRQEPNEISFCEVHMFYPMPQFILFPPISVKLLLCNPQHPNSADQESADGSPDLRWHSQLPRSWKTWGRQHGSLGRRVPDCEPSCCQLHKGLDRWTRLLPSLRSKLGRTREHVIGVTNRREAKVHSICVPLHLKYLEVILLHLCCAIF